VICAGGPGAARAGQRSGASSAGAVAKGRPASSKEAPTITVSSDNRQQAPSAERGPERLRRGLPVGPAAGVRRCNWPSVRQSLREEGRQA